MNDKISFANDVTFNRFTIKDQKTMPFWSTEPLILKNFSNPGFDLTLDADNFQALNSKRKTMICFMAKCIWTII
jgi:hypothetical protein